MFWRKKIKSDEKNTSWVWTLMDFINRNENRNLIEKSDEFKSGFFFCIEKLREELVKLSD